MATGLPIELTDDQINGLSAPQQSNPVKVSLPTELTDQQMSSLPQVLSDADINRLSQNKINPAKQAMDFFLSKGWSKEQAAGIVGNIAHESSMNPNIWDKSGISYGLAQWTGPRLKDLMRYAQSKGEKSPTFQTQLDFIQSELEGPESRAGQLLSKTGNVQDATRVFSSAFERPGIPLMGKRIKYAEKAYQDQFGELPKYVAPRQFTDPYTGETVDLGTVAPLTNKIEDFVGQLGQSFGDTGKLAARAFSSGTSKFSGALDALADQISQVTGLPKGGVFQAATKFYKDNADYWDSQLQGKTTIPQEVVGEFIGGAAPTIADYALGPIWSLVRGGAEGGPTNAVKEMAKRYFLGKMFDYANRLSMPSRMATLGTYNAGETALEKSPQDIESGKANKDIGKSFVSGMTLGMLGPANVGNMSMEGVRNWAMDKAQRLVESAAKLPPRSVSNTVRDRFVNTILKTDNPYNLVGLEKYRDDMGRLNNQIAFAIDEGQDAGGRVNKAKVGKYLDQLSSYYDNAPPDLKEKILPDIQSIKEKFMESGDTMSPKEAQSMKQWIYQNFKKSYGEMKSYETEAHKAIARGLKDGLVEQYPVLSNLNERDSRLIELTDLMEKSLNRVRNYDVIPVGTSIMTVAGAASGGGPMAAIAGIAKQTLEAPRVKVALARAIAKAAGMEKFEPVEVPKIKATPTNVPSAPESPITPSEQGPSFVPYTANIQTGEQSKTTGQPEGMSPPSGEAGAISPPKVAGPIRGHGRIPTDEEVLKLNLSEKAIDSYLASKMAPRESFPMQGGEAGAISPPRVTPPPRGHGLTVSPQEAALLKGERDIPPQARKIIQLAEEAKKRNRPQEQALQQEYQPAVSSGEAVKATPGAPASQITDNTIINSETMGQVENRILKGNIGIRDELGKILEERIKAEGAEGLNTFKDWMNPSKVGGRIYQELRKSGMNHSEAKSTLSDLMKDYEWKYNEVLKSRSK